jgi:anti-sigma regulatory factor (Ser/Thr protein kinase)
MKIYKTDNIQIEDINVGDYSGESIEFVDDSNVKNWLYRGSLLNYLKDIPSEFESLVPLNYFNRFKLAKKQCQGNSLLQKTFQLENASEVINTITDAIAPINLAESFDDLKYYIILVSSELVRNGIILNLKHKMQRDISLTILESEDDILIKITDPYGELKCADFTKRLKAIVETGEYERKEYGAGLGLFMVIKAVDTIQFMINNNSKTQILCSINKYKRLKYFKEKETTVFFEVGE